MARISEIPPFPLRSLRVSPPRWPRFYRCPPGWTCDLRLADFDLWFVVRGRGRLVIDGRHRDVAGPQILVFQPGQHVLGSHDAAAPLEVFAFHFAVPPPDGRVARRLAEQLSGVTPRDPARLQERCGWLIDAAIEQDPTAAEHVAVVGLAILMQIWRDLHREPALPADWRVEAVMREIGRRPAESWNTRQLVREAGLSESHLTKRFRAISGVSPRQFVIRMRLRLAEALMQDTRLSLAQIAEAAGYRDVFFFSRQFKQVKGISPAAFRATRIPASTG